MTVPFRKRDARIGALHLDRRRGPGEGFVETDAAVVQALADVTSLVLPAPPAEADAIDAP